MANEVFANDLEIACKAADGYSPTAFPDPCWSPPPPSAGPIVVPYSNTAKASDTANGSKSVLISGKPVILRNKSYFSTSTGNEPATQAFKKGIRSGVITGKCYFTSWSMNVKIEKHNVCRHTDSTTHNHGSHPGNTGRWTYIDTRKARKACRKELEREGAACGGLEPKKVDKQGKVKKSWFGSDYKDVKKKQIDWKLKNCAGLGFAPTDLKGKGLTDLDSLKEKIGGSIDEIANIDKAVEMVADQVIDNMQGMIQELIAKGIIKKGVGAAAGTTGIGLIITAIAAADAIKDAIEMKDLLGQLGNMQDEAKRIKDEMSDMKQKLESIPESLKNGNAGEANDTLAELQRTIATANPCLRAKKCQLLSYENGKKQNKGSQVAEGCCKGQTPHHLIPDSYIKNANNPCPGYDRKSAPTVCAEGTTHNEENGSHGALHTSLDQALKDGDSINMDNSVGYADARDAAIESHRKTFPFSQCSKKCLKAQMDSYYDKKCEGKLQYTKMPGGIDAGSEDAGI